MIDNEGVVKVYYTDGTQEPLWAPICANLADQNVYRVICRQLGLVYQKQSAPAVEPFKYM